MKKILFLCVIAFAAVGCSSSTSLLKSTATHKTVLTSAVFADLNVSPTKITHFYMPTSTVMNGGEENVINTAIREALLNSGDADVFVGLEKQTKYDSVGRIESITITGYPAWYVNFRTPTEEDLASVPQTPKSEGGLKLPKFGKK